MVINWWVVSSHEKTHLEQRGSSVIRELKNRRPHKERESTGFKLASIPPLMKDSAQHCS